MHPEAFELVGGLVEDALEARLAQKLALVSHELGEAALAIDDQRGEAQVRAALPWPN